MQPAVMRLFATEMSVVAVLTWTKQRHGSRYGHYPHFEACFSAPDTACEEEGSLVVPSKSEAVARVLS